MLKISSNTIVKNGMPFIGKVLEQVAPYMHQMVITISESSGDGTIEEILKFSERHPGKVLLSFEAVNHPSKLTGVRDMQVQMSTGDWILFLDDDDYWTHEELEKCIAELEKDPTMLAYSVNPYQLIDTGHYDYSWRKRSFSKWIKNVEGLHYVFPWPRDLPADKEGNPLYWKTHPRVKRLPYKFYHLSYLKGGSFRKEGWASEFKLQIGRPIPLPKPAIL